MPQNGTAYQTAREFFPASSSTLAIYAAPARRVRVGQMVSPWQGMLEQRFDRIVKLPLGWDGYRGRPVSFGLAKFAASILEHLYISGVEAPQVVPGSDGTLQLEWHCEGYDIELDVRAPFDVVAYRFDSATGEEQEMELDADFTLVAGWIEDISHQANRSQNVA